MEKLTLTLICLALSACCSPPYRNTTQAKFTGALDVRWVSSDYFLFLPNKEEPLTLLRANGTKIQPGPMFTDGGSIPRFLWGVKGYSPWGYAPAYIVHDWLFEAKHCGHKPDSTYTFDDSVNVMAEALKAVMEASPEVRNYFLFDSVVGAVASPIARRLWEEGECKAPPLKIKSALGSDDPGELLMTIRFK